MDQFANSVQKYRAYSERNVTNLEVPLPISDLTIKKTWKDTKYVFLTLIQSPFQYITKKGEN